MITHAQRRAERYRIVLHTPRFTASTLNQDPGPRSREEITGSREVIERALALATTAGLCERFVATTPTGERAYCVAKGPSPDVTEARASAVVTLIDYAFAHPPEPVAPLPPAPPTLADLKHLLRLAAVGRDACSGWQTEAVAARAVATITTFQNHLALYEHAPRLREIVERAAASDRGQPTASLFAEDARILLLQIDHPAEGT